MKKKYQALIWLFKNFHHQCITTSTPLIVLIPLPSHWKFLSGTLLFNEIFTRTIKSIGHAMDVVLILELSL